MHDFAIIIPNLNQSHFLPTLFESLNAQSASYATAVMDGGSQDDFTTITSTYQDLIQYSRSHPDNGQSAAINEGSRKIRGKYITWLNADDYYYPYTLAYIRDLFNRYPECDVIYGNAIHVDRDGNFLSYFPPAIDFDQKELTRNCFICQPACFMRSEAFFKVGGLNPNLHYTMDWDLWCRLSQQGSQFLYVDKPLAAVRYYPDTKTLSGNYKRLLEMYRHEQRYGKRRLKLSWLLSYYYGLTLRDRTFSESLFYYPFKALYEARQHLRPSNGLTQKKNKLLYGFHRWKPIVRSKCEIHFPWFQETSWKTLRLKLKPLDGMGSYRLSVSDLKFNMRPSQNDYLVLELDEHAPNYALITIENQNNANWVLESFSVV